jgi:hypothetical protein
MASFSNAFCPSLLVSTKKEKALKEYTHSATFCKEINPVQHLLFKGIQPFSLTKTRMFLANVESSRKTIKKVTKATFCKDINPVQHLLFKG